MSWYPTFMDRPSASVVPEYVAMLLPSTIVRCQSVFGKQRRENVKPEADTEVDGQTIVASLAKSDLMRSPAWMLTTWPSLRNRPETVLQARCVWNDLMARSAPVALTSRRVVVPSGRHDSTNRSGRVISM